MVVNIHNLIAAINPDVYCKDEEYVEEEDGKITTLVKKVKKEIEEEKKRIIDTVEAKVKEALEKIPDASSEERKKVEKDVREKTLKTTPGIDYIKIAKIAKAKTYEEIDFVKAMYGSAVSDAKSLLSSPVEMHKIIYDATGETLEPLYFWIIDSIGNLGLSKIDKIVDTFASTVGSGHFSEMGPKASRMQEEAMKMFGTVNAVLKSILNIVYDLKEFKMRLETYDALKSKDETTKRAAIYSLKQIWMDSVDAKRGTTSLKGLAQNFDYVTLIDAFMMADSAQKIASIDLNDRVKRILEQRYTDFDRWLKESELELRKRFEVEKIYLKSQYNTVKLYARWIRPYLEAASKLEQRADASNAGLVNMFSTTLFELVVTAMADYSPNDEVASGDLPKIFLNAEKRTGKKRIYHPMVIFEFKFRSAPERFGQNYAFRGKADITFAAYALNDEEIKTLKEQLDKSDVGDLMKWIMGSTDDSLGKIQDDIDSLLPEEKVESKPKESNTDVNPFKELVNFFKDGISFGASSSSWKDKIVIRPDDDLEKVIRSRCVRTARMRCTKFYEIYKKAHKMQAFGATEDAF